MSLVDNRFLCLSGGFAITRFFAELDSVLNGHYVYANTLVFGNGDTFEFEFLAPTSVVSANKYLTDSDNSTNRAYCLMHTSGQFQINPANISSVFLDGVSVSLSSNYPTDGKLHKLMLNFSAAARIGMLGVHNSGANQSYDGILADAVATIGGVTTTNPLGLATGNSEPSLEANNTITYVNIPDSNREKYTLIDGSWIGRELINNVGGFFVLDSSCTFNNGTIDVDGTEGANVKLARRIGMVVIGDSYLTSYSILNYVSGASIRMRLGNFVGASQQNPGTYEEVQTAETSTEFYMQSTGNNFKGSFIVNSVKRSIEIA